MKKIYIAGPDVFSPNCQEIGEKYKKICEDAGFEGIYPISDTNKKVSAFQIAENNFKAIDDCDYVVANCNPFRGKEMDSGTACEIGYAIAKGKDVYCYLDDATSLINLYGEVDENGFYYEDFNFPLNLMIATQATIIEGTFRDVVALICFKNFDK